MKVKICPNLIRFSPRSRGPASWQATDSDDRGQEKKTSGEVRNQSDRWVQGSVGVTSGVSFELFDGLTDQERQEGPQMISFADDIPISGESQSRRNKGWRH